MPKAKKKKNVVAQPIVKKSDNSNSNKVNTDLNTYHSIKGNIDVFPSGAKKLAASAASKDKYKVTVQFIPRTLSEMANATTFKDLYVSVKKDGDFTPAALAPDVSESVLVDGILNFKLEPIKGKGDYLVVVRITHVTEEDEFPLLATLLKLSEAGGDLSADFSPSTTVAVDLLTFNNRTLMTPTFIKKYDDLVAEIKKIQDELVAILDLTKELKVDSIASLSTSYIKNQLATNPLKQMEIFHLSAALEKSMKLKGMNQILAANKGAPSKFIEATVTKVNSNLTLNLTQQINSIMADIIKIETSVNQVAEGYILEANAANALADLKATKMMVTPLKTVSTLLNELIASENLTKIKLECKEDEVNVNGECKGKVTCSTYEGYNPVDNSCYSKLKVVLDQIPFSIKSCQVESKENEAYSCTIDIGYYTEQGEMWSLAETNTCSFLAIDSTTGILTGTPLTANVGTCSLEVTVTDQIATQTAKLAMTVRDKNYDPTTAANNSN